MQLHKSRPLRRQSIPRHKRGRESLGAHLLGREASASYGRSALDHFVPGLVASPGAKATIAPMGTMLEVVLENVPSANVTRQFGIIRPELLNNA